MTKFDLIEVREFADSIEERMNRCDNGEGMECATLDSALTRYANLCRDFTEEVRRWGREVFAARVAFDPEVEKTLQSEGRKLFARANELSKQGREAEEPCHILEGQDRLELALGRLDRLLKRWVTPKPSIGPSARQGLPLDIVDAEEVRRRLDALPPPPADWQPDDPRQRAFARILRNS